MLLFDNSRFYRLNLNCRGNTYYGYVNIEETRTKFRVYVSPLHRLPFADNKVKSIFVDFEPMRTKKNLYGIFREWGRVIVPNGILMIDNIELSGDIERPLLKTGFVRVYFEFQKNLPCFFFIYNPPKNFYDIDGFYSSNNGNALFISKQEMPGSDKVRPEDLIFENEGFDEISIVNVLEYIAPESIQSFILKLKGFLKPGGALKVLVNNERFLEDGKYISFFDKASLAQYFTESGFLIEKIDMINDSINMYMRKKRPFSGAVVAIQKPRRICAIGQYIMNRYNQLGFNWDGIPRAMDELEYDYMLLEGMRNMDNKILRKAILEYKPEYILLLLKENLPLLLDIAGDLKKIGTKTIFWFTDPDKAWQMDLNGVLDFMFLNNTGQIEDYKKCFNIKNVHFMAQPCTPSIMHKCNLPEIYDVGFAGALSKDRVHDTRRKVMSELSDKFKTAVTKHTRNNISEFYSQCKIVFGASDFKYELYTSNRIYVAMSCARLYLTNKFPGIERLFENKKHLLWFEDYNEVVPLAQYYLRHDNERNNIAMNAAKIVHAKHTYKERLKNIFDIVDGKTKDFYGFLE